MDQDRIASDRVASWLERLTREQKVQVWSNLLLVERDRRRRETDGVDPERYNWRRQARPNQLAPEATDWSFWMLLAGRGFGKTRSGAEWVRSQVACNPTARGALVAPTAGDCRDVMVEGESGLLAICPPWDRPAYEPSKRRLTWKNGAMCTLYSADEPDRLRGPQHSFGWADEIASWRYPEAWDMLMFGMRLGKRPRVVVTTTPKPVKIVRELLDDPTCVVTRASTYENRENLPPSFFDRIIKKYEGTRLGRQEINAEVLEDVPGALWTREMIDRARVGRTPNLTRVVVAIDPAASSNEDSDETGIVVVGRDGNDHGYVLADRSGRYSPAEWARVAIQSYVTFGADRIVAEVNHGGEMIEATLRNVDPGVPYTPVRASRGKVVRAEPVAAMYEQTRVHHQGSFPELEDQMCGFTSDFDAEVMGYSPDRVDALVWALTDLMAASAMWSAGDMRVVT